MKLFFIALLLLLTGAISATLFKNDIKLKLCTFFSGLAALFALIPSLTVLLTGNTFGANIYFSPVFGNITFLLDPLSAFFTCIISVMSFLGIIYANGYMKPYFEKKSHMRSHCFFLMLLILSMLAVVTVQNALFFIIVWEIMSLSSFFLVIFEGNKKEVLTAGIKYMIYMHISVIFIMILFAFLNIKSGSLNFADFVNVFQDNRHIKNVVFLLAFIGFGTKAGFVPFHNWLPDAHPAAPSHVSGIMSGVMIKTGIYGILRILFLIGIPTKFIAYTLLSVSIISSLWGVLYAITKHDIKQLLAYHSIENIGIIGIGIGTGLIGVVYNNPLVAVLGFAGGILHILNHSIFKELLFFAAGSVYLKTHTRNIEKLGGLVSVMPYTSLCFIIGSVAICAIPPFNGFISEFLIYASMLSGFKSYSSGAFVAMIIAVAALALVGTMAVLCFTKASGIMFLGNPRTPAAQNVENDSPKSLLIPMFVLSFFAAVIGLFPQYFTALVLSPVSMFVNFETPDIFLSVINMMSNISVLFFVFMLIFAFVFLLRFLFSKNYKTHETWGCGYKFPTSRIQYSAASYADLFVSTMKPMFKRITHVKKPKGLFPDEAYYEVETRDIEEAYIINPLLNREEKTVSFFERIQDGNIRHYMLIGLIFLILCSIGLFYFG